MRRDLCMMAALCLLVSLLAVAMATERKTGPGLTGFAVAEEENTGQGPLPPSENDQRQSSPKLDSEYERSTTGSNSSVSAAGKGHLHVLLSSSDQEQQVLQSSISISQDDKERILTDTPNEEKLSSFAASPYDPDEDHGTGRLLVAVARTLVTTTASTTTITVLSTCHNTGAGGSALPTNACTGRKRKSVFRLANSETGLDSSIAGGLQPVNKRNVKAGRFILWSSSVTTVTIRTTSTNAATPVTAVFPCSTVGLMACG